MKKLPGAAMLPPNSRIRVFRRSLIPRAGSGLRLRRLAWESLEDRTLLAILTGADAGGGPHARLIHPTDLGDIGVVFPYFENFSGGVRVAAGDLNADGIDDVVTAAGAGGGPHIRAFSGDSGAELRNFFAYAPGFSGGVFVACGDVNGDGTADIITGAGAGGGPHVKVFNGVNGAELISFFAYASSFTGGVTVTAGDINGDGKADIITGAGPGGGPHVRVFSGANVQEIRSFFAYDASFRGGVFVGAGDINGDGKADIITGAGAGGGPHVRVFSGANDAELMSFFAYEAQFSGGVRVAAGDVNFDGRPDIITGAGPGGGPHVRVLSGVDGRELQSFFAYDAGFRGGVFTGFRVVANPTRDAQPFMGDLPEPANVTYDSPSGALTVLAYPGLVYVQVQSNVSSADAAARIQNALPAQPASIVARFPVIGDYWAQVPVGSERALINAVRQQPGISSAIPLPVTELHALTDESCGCGADVDSSAVYTTSMAPVAASSETVEIRNRSSANSTQPIFATVLVPDNFTGQNSHGDRVLASCGRVDLPNSRVVAYDITAAPGRVHQSSAISVLLNAARGAAATNSVAVVNFSFGWTGNPATVKPWLRYLIAGMQNLQRSNPGLLRHVVLVQSMGNTAENLDAEIAPVAGTTLPIFFVGSLTTSGTRDITKGHTTAGSAWEDHVIYAPPMFGGATSFSTPQLTCRLGDLVFYRPDLLAPDIMKTVDAATPDQRLPDLNVLKGAIDNMFPQTCGPDSPRRLPGLSQAQGPAPRGFYVCPPLPPPGFVVTPTAGLVTTESGGTATFTVRLASPATANVLINLSSSDTTEGTVSPSSLTFTPANWGTPQSITVTGVNDAFADGDIAYQVITSPASGAGSRYEGLNPPDVALVNRDNEPALSIGDVTTTEGNSGQRVFRFPITIEGSLEADTVIEYRIANFPLGAAPPDARATPGTDFQSVPRALMTIPRTATSASIDAVVISDNQAEPDEVFFVHLFVPLSDGGAIGAHVRDNEGIGKILNDDTPPPPAGPGQIVVTVQGNGFVTDDRGRIDTRIGDNIGTYGPSEFPFLIANGFLLDWIGTACFTNSCPITPNEFANGLNVTAVFASSLVASASESEPAGDDCGCSHGQEELDRLARAAIARWAAAGLKQSELERLAGLEIRFEELAGELLARSALGVIAVDRNAAGHGWFIDPTPWDDEEFVFDKADQVLHALENGEAEERIDLLTVLAHEIGHLLGFEHSDEVAGNLMNATLEPGVRRLPAT